MQIDQKQQLRNKHGIKSRQISIISFNKQLLWVCTESEQKLEEDGWNK